MAGWLQKIFPPAPNPQNRQLPTTQASRNVRSVTPLGVDDQIPNASLIYGTAAGILFGVSLVFFFTGRWFTGGLVLLVAGCFLGFALHFLKAR